MPCPSYVVGGFIHVLSWLVSTGVGGWVLAQYVGEFASPGDAEYAPPVTRGELKAEKKARITEARKATHDEVLGKAVAAWDPQATAGATEDPYKTLFVAKINYDTPEVNMPPGSSPEICGSGFLLYFAQQRQLLVHSRGHRSLNLLDANAATHARGDVEPVHQRLEPRRRARGRLSMIYSQNSLSSSSHQTVAELAPTSRGRGPG